MSHSVRPHRRQPTRLHHPWDSPGKNTGVGCHFLLQCIKVKSESEVAQLCLTLSDPMDCRLPGSSVDGIFQARLLEWVAISFSRGSSQPRGQTQVSHIAGRHFTVWAAREALRLLLCKTQTPSPYSLWLPCLRELGVKDKGPSLQRINRICIS